MECGPGPTTITVRVVPGARKSEVVGVTDGVLRVRVAAPAVDGKANDELLRLLAEHFGVRARRLTITKGAHHRTKLIAIDPT
jgi:uncharacterized protein